MQEIKGPINEAELIRVLEYLDCKIWVQTANLERFVPEYLSEKLASIREYEENSRFGNDFEQIKQRARNEVLSSDRLLADYLKIVYAKAEGYLGFMLNEFGSKQNPAYQKLMQKHIISEDVLRIIN